MSRMPSKSFACSVVGETVTIALRRRVSIGASGTLFVQCGEHECQYVDANEPPCPLSLDLFDAEISDRMRTRST